MTTGILDYRDLLAIFQPRPIVNEWAYDATVTQINRLIDKGDLTTDEQDLLTLLGTLVMAYEDEHYPDEQFELEGLALLKALIEEAKLSQEDLLPVFGTQAILTAVFNGKQSLNTEQSHRLAAFFDLPCTLFLTPAQIDQPIFA